MKPLLLARPRVGPQENQDRGIPATRRCSVEKEGSLTTAEVGPVALQGVEPPGDAISDGDMVNRLILKLKELYKKEGGKFPSRS